MESLSVLEIFLGFKISDDIKQALLKLFDLLFFGVEIVGFGEKLPEFPDSGDRFLPFLFYIHPK